MRWEEVPEDTYAVFDGIGWVVEDRTARAAPWRLATPRPDNIFELKPDVDASAPEQGTSV